MKMLAMVARAAHENGISAGICGELAADTSVTHALIHMGFDKLSVSPSFILPLRKAIREMTKGVAAND
jgi:phosphotransferase system enzyme I (PtsI)